MGIEHMWAHASGIGVDDFSVLGYRFDSRWGLSPTEMDSHIVLSEPGLLRAPLLTSGWLTGLWRSTTSKVTFVADAKTALHRVLPTPRDDGTFVDSETTPTSMAGVWGLDDEHVFAWGDAGPETSMYRWDGRRWNDMPCPGRVFAMHGISPDVIFAVGERGLVARWDGHRWDIMPSGTRARLASVFVVSPDEVYACGTAGIVVEGSVHGFSMRMRAEAPLYSIAQFGGRLLVAGGPQGLLQIDGTNVEVLTAEVRAEKLEAREQLVLTCPDAVYVSPDFVEWTGVPIGQFEPLVSHREPAWETHPL